MPKSDHKAAAVAHLNSPAGLNIWQSILEGMIPMLPFLFASLGPKLATHPTWKKSLKIARDVLDGLPLD